MITNIDIDDELVAQAMALSGARTKREVVDRALREMVARAKRPRIRDLWGIGGIYEDYDPKASSSEEFGKHRVEQGVATYKVPPPVQAAPAKSRSKR